MGLNQCDKTVSVIIPVYNVKDYIRKCLDSVVNQTYSKLEILVIDDGSPDESGAIAEEYAASDNRVKVIHRENGGLSAARNTGLKPATGEYIFFLDSDDWIKENTIETLLRMAEVDNADIVACGIEKVWDDGRKELWTDEVPGIWNGRESVSQMIHATNLCSVAVNKLYKKSLWENLNFPERCLHEDEYTTYKALYTAQKVVYIPDGLYQYYQRDNGIMSSEVSKRGEDYLKALRERMAFFENHNDKKLYDESLLQYLEYIKYLYRESNDEDQRQYWVNEYKSKVGLAISIAKIPLKKKIALILWKYYKYNHKSR